ncbi:MAG TPA: chlorite dismutase family protein [Chloroflexia bacterium]|nr:chlorite dismutase family protein [Chloroflexia bacterium]
MQSDGTDHAGQAPAGEEARVPGDQGSRSEAAGSQGEGPQFVQFLFFRVDPAWRRVPKEESARGRREFTQVVEQATEVKTFAYSTLGLKVDADLMLWRIAPSLDELQDMLARLRRTGLGQYLHTTYSLFGMTRPSQYTRRRTTQEQAIDEQERHRYLIVYPFSKTTEWYLMSKETRQGMMNEHMRVGHEYAQVRQVLLYTTGLDDQEFVVAYETEDLYSYQGLLIALRSTEARRYTLKDQPIFTCIHRPLNEAIKLLG